MKKENKFIIKNQKKWEDLNLLLKKRRKKFLEIYKLGKLYQQTTEDLSFAQTNFPDSDITAYLNQIVSQCHMTFHKRKASRFKKLLSFYSITFPKILAQLSIPVLISAIIFLSSISISFFMVKNNTELGEIFLPPSTYAKAMHDLESRKKFSNFDDIPEEARGFLSFFLWYNNSMVSMLCFIFGITLGLGTIYILIQNGFMLGALFAIYYMNGQFLDFYSIIMVHGSIELIAIIISGGAGLSLMAAIVFPKRMPRAKKLKQNAHIALLALGGVVSLLLVAGLIEGLITPLKLPVPYRLFIAVINTILLCLYYWRGVILRNQDKSL